MKSFVYFLCLVGLGGYVTAQTQPGTSHVELVPGVHVLPDQGRVLAMTPQKGVVSVAIQDGQKQWETFSGSMPLAYSGDRVALLVEGQSKLIPPKLVYVNLNDGSLIPDLGFELPLGPGDHGRLDQRLGRNFEVVAQADTDELRVWWQSTRTLVQGANLAPPIRFVEGQRATPSKKVPFHSNNQGVMVHRLGDNSAAPEPFRAAPESAGFSLAPAQERIEARNYNHFISMDGKHVLASSFKNYENGVANWTWNIYDRATKALVGTVNGNKSGSPFVVSGGTLLRMVAPIIYRSNDEMVEVPYAVEALNLAENLSIWQVSVRDTRYNGPLPH